MKIRPWALIAGALAYVAVAAAAWDAPPQARAAAAMVAIMAVWWATEAVPIWMTALAPLLLVPATACFLPREPAAEAPILRWLIERTGWTSGAGYQMLRAVGPYFDGANFLFLGGMAIAAAMERAGLHRRVALAILARTGTSAGGIVLGFVLSAGFVSLWISNTATAVMMLPIGMAVLSELERREGRALAHLGLAVMLAIAYGANVGGIGTKIGTAPNVVFANAAGRAGVAIGFLDYMLVGLPFVAMFLPVVWLVLRRIARRDALAAGGGAEILRAQYAALGPMSAGERAVAIVFVAAAAAWIGGRPLAAWLGPDPAAMDAITAMTAALVLVLLGRLDAQALRRIPWGVVVLLGGSFAMVDAVSGSGLDRRIASGMGVIAAWPAPAMFLAVAATAVFASAAASNTATATLMMPVLMGAVPRAFVVPMMGTAAIAMSCDFMLPAGTPPNAIVFGSGRVSLRAMVRVGFLLDVLAALFAGLWGWLGVRLILPAPGP